MGWDREQRIMLVRSLPELSLSVVNYDLCSFPFFLLFQSFILSIITKSLILLVSVALLNTHITIILPFIANFAISQVNILTSKHPK